jgi:hypothetical protein
LSIKLVRIDSDGEYTNLSILPISKKLSSDVFF